MRSQQQETLAEVVKNRGSAAISQFIANVQQDLEEEGITFDSLREEPWMPTAQAEPSRSSSRRQKNRARGQQAMYVALVPMSSAEEAEDLHKLLKEAGFNKPAIQELPIS